MAFDITKKNTIYIYGGGKLGRSYYEQLQQDGFSVKAIIDRNADKLTYSDKKISLLTLEQFSSVFKKDDIVIICVHNALWHAEIVESLKSIGVEKILFIPLNKNFSRQGSNEMMKAYTRFTNRDYASLKNIPSLSDLLDHGLNPQKAILYETGDSVICWIDVTSLYTSQCVAEASSRHAPKDLEAFADTPMPGMLPYVKLFRLLAGKDNGEGNSFVRLCKRFQNSIDEYSDEEFLNDRFDLYNELNTQLNFGIDRFVESAPDCEWNEKGFFNLLDGMSRTTFLYTKGFLYVPVKMKKAEFQFWGNQEVVLQLIDNKLAKATNWEIEHPSFIDYPVKQTGVKQIVLSAIEEYFNHSKFAGKQITDYTETDGCISRYFARQGGTVLRVVKEENEAFEKGLCNLFHLEDKIRVSSIDQTDSHHADIVCITVNCDNLKEVTTLFGNIKDAVIVCLYHQMEKDTIEGLETETNISAKWKQRIQGRENITMCVY